MCLRIMIMQSTPNYSDKREKLKTLLNNADAVMIGAGAGLSMSAGFIYSGKRFHENFHDFEAEYGFHDMYSGGFYPYDIARRILGLLVKIYLYKSL